MQAPSSSSNPAVATCSLLSHQEQWVRSSSVSPVHQTHCSLQVLLFPVPSAPAVCSVAGCHMLVKLG